MAHYRSETYSKFFLRKGMLLMTTYIILVVVA